MSIWSRIFGHRRSGLADLREQQERLKLQLEVARLKSANKLVESAMVPDWVGSFVDLMDRYRDGDRLLSPISTPNDRRGGRNFPIFQTEQELALLRAPSRIICTTNSHAIGLLSGLTSYIIGDGCTYRAVAKRDDTPKELVKRVQDVIDEFSERVLLGELEQELFHRSREDGEYFLRHGLDDNGLTWVRTVEPEQVFQPPGTDQADWGFGVLTDREDVWARQAYYVAYLSDPAKGEEVPAEEMIHCKVNTKRSIKRGLPDFAFDTYEALRTASKLRLCMGEGAAVQASIAAVLQHDATSVSQVNSFQAQRIDGTTQDPVTGRSTDYQKVSPGTELQIPKGMTYVMPPGWGSNGPNFIQIFAAQLRSAGVRWNAPEWLGSADASNNNYASALVGESPFVKTGKRWQGLYGSRFKASVRIAVRHAIEAGRLPADTLERVDVQAKLPSIEARKIVEEAQANQIYMTSRVKSPQTVQQELSLDTKNEQKNWEEFDDANGRPGAQLPLPGENAGGGAAAAGPGTMESWLGESVARVLLECGGRGGKPGPCGHGGGGDDPPPATAAEISELGGKLPAGADAGGPWEKAKGLYGRVRGAAYAGVARVLAHAHEWAPEILDTAEDYAKLTYHKAGDALMQHTGVPANVAAVVVSHALAKAVMLVKNRLRRESVAEPNYELLAGLVVELVGSLNDALGLDLPPPDGGEVESAIKAKVQAQRKAGR